MFIGHLAQHKLIQGYASERRRHAQMVWRRLYLPSIPALAAAAILIVNFNRTAPYVWFLLPIAFSLYCLWWRRLVAGTINVRAEIAHLDNLLADAKRNVTACIASHNEAVRILKRAMEEFTPFILFLRNFEIEAFNTYVPSGVVIGSGPLIATMTNRESRLENQIAAPLTRFAPAIAIGNPSEILPVASNLPRLQLPNEDWQGTLHSLLEWASLIVMDLEDLTPGVRVELDAITGNHREEDTIIVLPGGGERRSAELRHFAEIMSGVAGPSLEAVTRDSAALERFEEIIESDRLDFKAIEEDPVFKSKLQRIKFVNELSLEQRLKRREVLRTNGEALQECEEGHFEAAYSLLNSALASAQDLRDKELMAVSLLNLGQTEIGLKRPKAAASTLTQGLTIAKEIADRQLVRKFQRDLGNLCFGMRDFQAALEFYAEFLSGYQAIRKYPPVRMVLNTGWCCQRLGHMNNVKALVELIERRLRASQDDLTEARRLLELAAE